VSGEWAQEALRLMEESGEHFATGEGGEEVCFVALNDGGAFIPMVVTVEEDMVDGVTIAAVGACGVIPDVPPKTGGVVGVECVSCD
jgi:hypothetical protein